MVIRYRDDAQEDMRNIIRHGIEHGLPDPVAFVHSLRDRIAHLADIKHPGRKGRVAGTREWVLTSTPYLVVYAIEGDGNIGVWRMLHGAQRWPA